MPFVCELFAFRHWRVAMFTHMREALTARFHSEGHSRASERETGRGTDSHAFLLYNIPIANEERTEGN